MNYVSCEVYQVYKVSTGNGPHWIEMWMFPSSGAGLVQDVYRTYSGFQNSWPK